MHEIMSSIVANHTLRVSLLAWLIAQVLKVIFSIISVGKVDLTRLVGAGGMPSSHSALVMALAVSVGQDAGWDTPLFTIALVFAFVVMYDAAGVRRAAGKQAEAINQIINDIYRGEQISQERLKELIGHTPVEVLAGALLGIIIAFIL